MELTPDLLTSIPFIDMQHKDLINRINAVVALGALSVSKEETEKTLEFLRMYIDKHFNDEEIIQRQFGYPKYEWHRGQHQYYISECMKLNAEYKKNGPSAQFTLILNKSIIDWIIKHIKTADVELGQYVNSQKKRHA